MPTSRLVEARSPIAKAVVPAAGLGTRLRPLSQAFPKELLPVGREPVLAHVARELLAAGVTQALFVVSERKPQIRGFFGDSYLPSGLPEGTEPLRCCYVNQDVQRGSGDAVLRAEAWVGGEPFIVAFGDCLIDAGPGGDSAAPLRRLIATHREQGAAASIVVEQVAWDKVSRYGVLKPEGTLPDAPTESFAASDVIEKPPRELAPSNLVVAARLALNAEIFDFLRRADVGGGLDERGELNLIDRVREMRQAGGPLWATPLHPGEARRDIGSFDSFFAAFVRAALRDPEFGGGARRVAEEEISRQNSPS